MKLYDNFRQKENKVLYLKIHNYPISGMDDNSLINCQL